LPPCSSIPETRRLLDQDEGHGSLRPIRISLSSNPALPFKHIDFTGFACKLVTRRHRSETPDLNPWEVPKGFYEAVVRVPDRLAKDYEADGNERRLASVLSSGSPVRYYLPAVPVVIGGALLAVRAGWRQRNERAWLAALDVSAQSGVVTTAWLVRTVNLKLFITGSKPRGLLLALRIRLPPPVPRTSFHVISSDHAGHTRGAACNAGAPQPTPLQRSYGLSLSPDITLSLRRSILQARPTGCDV
jgi:hypothetical protein